MHAVLRPVPVLVLSAALAAGLGGCVKMKDTTRVLPDGSGKFALRMGIRKATYDKLKALADRAAEKGRRKELIDLGRLEEQLQGFVAFRVTPEPVVEGEWAVFDVVGYFEDLNRVRMLHGDGEEREVKLSFSLVRDGEATVLEARNQLAADADLGAGAPGTEELDETRRSNLESMATALLDGFEIESVYEVPGPILEVEHAERRSAHTAGLRITLADLLDPERARAVRRTGTRRVRYGASTLAPEEVEAFRKELSDAKAAWERQRAEARAAASREGADAAPPAPPREER